MPSWTVWPNAKPGSASAFNQALPGLPDACSVYEYCAYQSVGTGQIVSRGEIHTVLAKNGIGHGPMEKILGSIKCFK